MLTIVKVKQQISLKDSKNYSNYSFYMRPLPQGAAELENKL